MLKLRILRPTFISPLDWGWGLRFGEGEGNEEGRKPGGPRPLQTLLARGLTVREGREDFRIEKWCEEEVVRLKVVGQ